MPASSTPAGCPAVIGFRIKELFVRFILPITTAGDAKYARRKVRGYMKPATEQQRINACEQETRQRWRALSLTVKAKLEAVECGITTLEQEFLAFVVLPGQDKTIGEWIIEKALPQIRGGEMPKMLMPHTETISDAEIVTQQPEKK